jgi:hypothetical protein
MSRAEKRLEDIIKGLSPEDKARLAIEDMFRSEPVLSESDYRKMMASMSSEEGRRFNVIASQYNSLRDNIRTLEHLATDIKTKLLVRDRILWWHRCLIYVVEAMIFDPKVAEPLLVQNPNVKPGKPFRLRLPFADITFGVWGRKRRSPIGPDTEVELHEGIIEALEYLTRRIRILTGEAKALYRYIVEESHAIGLEFMAGWATMLVNEVAYHDVSYSMLTQRSKERFARWEAEGLTHEECVERILNDEPEPVGCGIFPVDDRWALVWDDIEENQETAQRVRKTPTDWMPVSYEDDVKGIRGTILDDLKELARIGMNWS